MISSRNYKGRFFPCCGLFADRITDMYCTFTVLLFLSVLLPVCINASPNQEHYYSAAAIQIHHQTVKEGLAPKDLSNLTRSAARRTAQESMGAALRLLRPHLEETKRRGIELVVTPESFIQYGHYDTPVEALPWSEEVDARWVKNGKSLCDDNRGESSAGYVVKTVACLAVEFNTTLAVNMIEWAGCDNRTGSGGGDVDPFCAKWGFLMYNLDVVLSERGELLAKYRKEHPWMEKQVTTDPNQKLPVTFTMSNGVTFAILTCFDVLFRTPGSSFAAANVQNAIHLQSFVSLFPYATVPAVGQSYSRMWNLTLISSSQNFRLGQGSGIYSHGNPIAYDAFFAHGDFVVMAQKIPKKPLPASYTRITSQSAINAFRQPEYVPKMKGIFGFLPHLRYNVSSWMNSHIWTSQVFERYIKDPLNRAIMEKQGYFNFAIEMRSFIPIPGSSGSLNASVISPVNGRKLGCQVDFKASTPTGGLLGTLFPPPQYALMVVRGNALGLEDVQICAAMRCPVMYECAIQSIQTGLSLVPDDITTDADQGDDGDMEVTAATGRGVKESRVMYPQWMKSSGGARFEQLSVKKMNAHNEGDDDDTKRPQFANTQVECDQHKEEVASGRICVLEDEKVMIGEGFLSCNSETGEGGKNKTAKKGLNGMPLVGVGLFITSG
eukprot:Nk52_evm10s212 gene=Nk52_evmTU10s212